MSIEKTVKRTTINFPTPLAFAEAEDLFNYISQRLKVEIKYNLNCNKWFIPDKKNSKARVKLEDIQIGKISIIDSKNYIFETPLLVKSKGEFLSFSSLKFDPFSNYSLLDNVRNIVNDYFNEKSKNK